MVHQFTHGKSNGQTPVCKTDISEFNSRPVLHFAVVAQLVERHPSKLDVAGSSPVCRTTSINNSMKAIILSLLTLGLAGCYTTPPPPPPPKVVVVDQNGNPVNPQPTVVVVKPYPVYPEVTWHIGIGLGRGYYRPGPWRHPHRW